MDQETISDIMSSIFAADNRPKVKEPKKPKERKRRETPSINLGHKFQSEISKSLEAMVYPNGPVICYGRFSDTNLYDFKMFCPHCHKAFRSNLILPKQPADHWVLTQTRVYFIEDKATTNADHFPLGNIAEHQMRYAELCERTPVTYYFLINNRSKPHNYTCHALTLRDIRNIIADTGRRSMLKWDDIAAEGIEARRDTRNQMWDLKHVIK